MDEPPADFTPEEIREWKELCTKAPRGVRVNPDYIRAGRKGFMRTLMNPRIIEGNQPFPRDYHDR